MLRNTFRHLLFIAQQLAQYLLIITVVIALGTIFALVNSSAGNVAAIYENVKTYSFMGITLIAFLFFNASAMLNHVFMQYNLTRRCLFLSTQISKVLMSIIFVIFHQIVILFVNLLQQTPYSINLLIEGLPNITLFIFFLSLGEFAGQITLLLGKFGIVLYTLCFGIVGGFVGFFAVSDVTVIAKISEFMVTASANIWILPIIYLAAATILSVASYFMQRKASV